MNTARSLLAAPLLLLALGSGCGIGDALDEAFDSPSTDGPFEIEARVAAGVDPSQVRAGLFDVRDTSEATAVDGTRAAVEANIDILVSVEGKAKLINQPASVETVVFRPVELIEPSADGLLVVDLPETADEDAGYALVVWVDADGDGALTLSSVEGNSEFARSPSREFSERTMALHSIWPVAPEQRDDADGLYHAAAGHREDTPDGEQVYSDNWIADRELTGWTVTLSEPTM